MEPWMCGRAGPRRERESVGCGARCMQSRVKQQTRPRAVAGSPRREEGEVCVSEAANVRTVQAEDLGVDASLGRPGGVRRRSRRLATRGRWGLGGTHSRPQPAPGAWGLKVRAPGRQGAGVEPRGEGRSPPWPQPSRTAYCGRPRHPRTAKPAIR